MCISRRCEEWGRAEDVLPGAVLCFSKLSTTAVQQEGENECYDTHDCTDNDTDDDTGVGMMGTRAI